VQVDLLDKRDLRRPDAAVKVVIAHFDKVAFRSPTRPNKAQLAVLRDNAHSVDVRTGHPIRGCNAKFIITIVLPKLRALEIAEECCWTPNYVEVAIDNIVSEWAEALRLHYFLDGSFVQSWHGKQQLIRYHPRGEAHPCATTYSGQRKANLRFAWYSDRLSKITNEPCLHLEARHQGVVACRRAGIYTPADLIHFDHRAHWQRYLACYRIDFAQLGLANANTSEGTRRHKPDINRSGYNIDAIKGAALFRALSAHERQEMRSVQRFVDMYGRGTFLQRLDVSALLSLSIDYIDECLKLIISTNASSRLTYLFPLTKTRLKLPKICTHYVLIVVHILVVVSTRHEYNKNPDDPKRRTVSRFVAS
jgi:hypothetical protein